MKMHTRVVAGLALVGAVAFASAGSTSAAVKTTKKAKKAVATTTVKSTATTAAPTTTVPAIIKVSAATTFSSLGTAPASLLVAMPELATQAGVDIKWTTVTAGPNCWVALIAGQVDVCYSSTSVGLDAIAQGEKLSFFVNAGTLATELVMSNEWIKKSRVRPNDPVEARLKALFNAKIASGAVTAAHGLLLQKLLEKIDFQWGRELTSVTMTDTIAMMEGVRAGKWDGVLFTAGSTGPIVADGTASVWISLPNGDMPDFLRLPYVAFAGKSSWVAKNEVAARRLQKAWSNAVSFMNDHPAEASAALKKRLSPDMEQALWDVSYKSVLPVFPRAGTATKKEWDQMLDLAKTSSANPGGYSGIVSKDVVDPVMRGDGW